MISFTINSDIKQKLRNLSIGTVYAEVENSEHDEKLWQEITLESNRIMASYSLENVKNQSNILSTREAYKKLGKDPNRYRPSAEALYRRILKGAPLYKISTLVDIINLMSLRSGYSIGGFDADKITGSVSLGIGKSEPFEAIGRGELNIENLPVYRDSHGAIGTPTSDHVRTSISMSTKKVFLTINSYSDENRHLESAVNLLSELLVKYGSGTNLETLIMIS